MQISGNLKFSTLGSGELQNAIIERLSSAPTGIAGRIYYDTGVNAYFYHNGTSWIQVGASTGSVASFSGGTTGLTPATPSTGVITLGGILLPANGGTGVANTSTITLGGNIVTSGAFPLTLTTTAATNLTLPTSGTLLTSTTAATSIFGTANQITTSASVGPVTLSTPSTFIAPGSISATTTLTIASNTASAFLYSNASKNVATTAAPLNGEILIGSTGVTPVVSTLTPGTGISVTNGAGTITIANIGVTSVSATSSSTGLTIGGSPITTTGTLTFALSTALQNLSQLAGTGFIVETAAGIFTNRSITGSSNIVVTNGNGVTASPTLDLSTITQGASGSFLKFTLDGFGRITANTPVVVGDLTGLLGTYYLPTTGGTMTGGINMGTNSITNLAAPVNTTDAATKGYVDASVSGLTWKTAVQVLAVSNITLSGLQTIDGYTTVTGDRVLVTGQTTGTQNGIYIAAAGAWTRSTDMAVGSNADNSAVFVENGTTYHNTGLVETANPAIVGTNTLVFTQFSGGAVYVAGTGINIVGNTVSAAYGAGITANPTNDIGLSLYNESTSGLILTTNGTTRSDVVGAGLALLLKTGGALTQDATGLYVATSSITNAMLVNSTVPVDVDGAGTTTMTLGTAFNFFGTTNRTTTSASANTVTFDISASYVGQASITTLGTVTTGNWNATTITAVHGGTGQSSYAVGDILYANSTTTLAKLSDVAAGSYLRSGGVSAAPVWSTVTLPNATTTGDIMYATGTNTFGVLADVATGNVLLSGGVGAIPSYGKVSLTTAITGVLPVVNGGTNLTAVGAAGTVLASTGSANAYTPIQYIFSSAIADGGTGPNTSFTVPHSLNQQFVNVTVYDSTFNQIIPQSVVLTNANTVTVTVNSAIDVFVVVMGITGVPKN